MNEIIPHWVINGQLPFPVIGYLFPCS